LKSYNLVSRFWASQTPELYFNISGSNLVATFEVQLLTNLKSSIEVRKSLNSDFALHLTLRKIYLRDIEGMSRALIGVIQASKESLVSLDLGFSFFLICLRGVVTDRTIASQAMHYAGNAIRLNPDVLTELAAHATNLQTLCLPRVAERNIAEAAGFTKELKKVLTTCKQLRKVDLSHNQLKSPVITLIAKHQPFIEEVVEIHIVHNDIYSNSSLLFRSIWKAITV